MITIHFEAHATTIDNEAKVASGHYDVELSDAGRKLAAEVKAERYKDTQLDAIFTSDLRRAYDTAEIMFAGRGIPIIKDARLRECDYGDLTRHPRAEMEIVRLQTISEPFPNGESMEQVMQRIKTFIDELSENYDGKTVLLIGHAATRYGLEHHINGVSLTELVSQESQFSAKYILS